MAMFKSKIRLITVYNFKYLNSTIVIPTPRYAIPLIRLSPARISMVFI